MLQFSFRQRREHVVMAARILIFSPRLPETEGEGIDGRGWGRMHISMTMTVTDTLQRAPGIKVHPSWPFRWQPPYPRLLFTIGTGFTVRDPPVTWGRGPTLGPPTFPALYIRAFSLIQSHSSYLNLPTTSFASPRLLFSISCIFINLEIRFQLTTGMRSMKSLPIGFVVFFVGLSLATLSAAQCQILFQVLIRVCMNMCVCACTMDA